MVCKHLFVDFFYVFFFKKKDIPELSPAVIDAI